MYIYIQKKENRTWENKNTNENYEDKIIDKIEGKCLYFKIQIPVIMKQLEVINFPILSCH